MKFLVHSSETVHQNPWYHIRHDTFTRPNQTNGEYFVIEFPGSCFVIAKRNNDLLVCRQYRYTIDMDDLEFVGGRIDPGESPEEAAKRELKEEAGLKTASLRFLGKISVLNGAAKSWAHVFIADTFTSADPETEQDEFELKTEWMPITEFEKRIRQNEIVDAETLAAWALYISKERV
ncbi:MAG TPA: NUDIX hydrolase [Patescibacteria group bacterium]|nr:NUDIX hydrolase [Patescibacteria group bacterium]